MKIDKFQEDLERELTALTESVDKDCASGWLDHPITKILMLETELKMLDRMKTISKIQPYDESALVSIAVQRGYLDSLRDLTEWLEDDGDEED